MMSQQFTKGKKKSMYCFYNLYTNNTIENDVNK